MAGAEHEIGGRIAVTVIAYQIQDKHIAGIHAAGCRDIARTLLRHDGVLSGTYDTLAGALTGFIDADMRDMGWTAADVEVFPCARREAA